MRLEIPASLTEPGFYEVQRDGQPLTTLAFNQDRRESELTAYSAAELRELVGDDRPNVRVLEGNTAETTLAQLREGQTGAAVVAVFPGAGAAGAAGRNAAHPLRGAGGAAGAGGGRREAVAGRA